MKNNPEDEDFIKRAHEDPNWPGDIDKPCDWNKVSLWQKIWFKIGGAVKGIFWLLVFCGLFIALIEFIDAGDGMDEPSCTQSPQGCYE
jgi:hypothetical protein